MDSTRDTAVFSADRRKISEWLKGIMAAASVVLLYAVLSILGIGCPIQFFTGISCAGCGMTRAWLCLLRLDLKGAVHYHPLFWIPPLFLVIYLLRRKLNTRFCRAAEAICAALFLVVYAARMIAGGGDVVVFEPENAFVLRMIRLLVSEMQQLLAIQ